MPLSKFFRRLSLMITLFCVSFSALSQTTGVTVNLNNATLSQLFSQIEQQTSYRFSYRSDVIDSKKDVTISMKNAGVEKILNSVLPKKNLAYNIVSAKSIVITRASRENKNTASAKENPEDLKTVTGTVIDQNGEPMIGATVRGSGNNAVMTDIDGKFELKTNPNKELAVSFIGYETARIKPGKDTDLLIRLKDNSEQLDEVVVIGYGTQKKVNLTGSVSAVSTSEFNSRPITQLSTALQGMASGVTVTTAGGAPGADGANIQIRGIGSFGGSDCSPLVLIDGVEGDMNSVDASQIDQISVLKDAASSAIYGSRAANGVILITTKRAQKGSFGLTYRGYVGWQKPVVYPDVVGPEDYMRLARLSAENDGATSIYTDEYIANYRKNNYLDPDAYPIIDWQKRLMNGNGFTQNHVISMNAGSEKIRSMTSFGYLQQNGIIKNSDYQRFNIRNNMDVKINELFNFRLDIAGTYARRNTNPFQGTVFSFMNAKDPIMLAQWSDGSYAPFTGGTTNPLPMIETGVGGNNIRQNGVLKGAASLEIKPLKWLNVELKVAPQLTGVKTHRFVDLVEYHSDPYGNVSPISNAEYNSLKETVSFAYNGYYHATLQANKDFGKHELRLLLGCSYENYDYYSLGAYRNSFAYPDYEVINAGGDNEFKDNEGTRNQMSLMSYFGRVNYNFDNRYLFEANLRYDGSSRFVKKHRWGLFPSFSAAWRLTEEKFMEPVTQVLSEFKLRASHGTLGNQNINSYYPASQNLTISSISAGGKVHPIVAQNSLANEDITWETTRMTDIGIDATLWNSFTIVADYYFKKTKGILMELDIPSTIGLGAPYQNAGVVTNKGWEIALGYRHNFGDFNFSVNANLSDVINKIVDMKGTYGTSGVIRNQEGSSINSLYLLRCLGMVQTQEQADWMNANCPQFGIETHPGDLVYEDYNKDGKITDADKQILGSLIPRYTYGLTLNLGWKGINLSAQFQGVGKADAYMSGAYTQPSVSGGTFQKCHLDNWTEQNPNAKYPRLSYTSNLNTKVSTFWMADASYFRLKNIQLSYSLPKKILKPTKLKGVMIYGNATNLFTITKFYNGYDPEISYQSGAQGATTGSIGSNYPLVSTYTFGVEVQF